MNLEKNIEMTRDSYNEVSYVSKTFSYTLPETQSLISRILGLSTKDIGNARVLEIGCSYGGNILSFAMANPNAEVVGIDLAEYQIEQGQKLIEYLDLKNIKLYHENVLDFDDSFGKFDYIICHGVFSWVPEIVQNKILEVIRKHLTENGTAVVSYNTYPGWKRLEFFKDAMVYRDRMLKDLGVNIEIKDRVSYGRGILEFLEENSSMSEEMKKISQDIRDKEAYYLYHEYYEENNLPLYFYDFNKKVEEAGLTYVGDTEMAINYPYITNKELGDLINQECGDNHIAKIQYYDFLRNTQFRRSILTHRENKDKINFTENIEIKNLEELYLITNYKLLKEETDELSQSILENLHKESAVSMIKIKDFAEKYYEKEEHRQVYTRIFTLLFFIKKLTATTQKREIIKEEKLKINDYNRKMLNYVMEAEYPIVHYSNYLGYALNLEKNEIEIMILFNGEKTDEEIIKVLEEINIKPEFTEEEKKEKYNEIVEFVKNLRVFIERNYLNLK